jgi:hypothetical protein
MTTNTTNPSVVVLPSSGHTKPAFAAAGIKSKNAKQDVLGMLEAKSFMSFAYSA